MTGWARPVPAPAPAVQGFSPSPEQLEEIRWMFTNYDANKDGWLSKEVREEGGQQEACRWWSGEGSRKQERKRMGKGDGAGGEERQAGSWGGARLSDGAACSWTCVCAGVWWCWEGGGRTGAEREG